ncbi:peptidoglycan DD-metalloendopeptidase family protein [Zhongshania sp.]|uniref:peptidoglycan DD-metalloendopeptidase family protein n=1 Tax=Zhongshania sp. TaxID=1971902 RepID=UPI002615BF3E|nr:peptidoglycan DD-metalloendopeptidase family protein [Zhongshania sp.]
MMSKLLRLLAFYGLICGLISCSSNGSFAPVSDRYSPAERTPPYYIVSAGDTLFSIAWRYGFELNGLATANSIASPYTIYPGQAILLKEGGKPLVKQRSHAKPAVAQPARAKPATTPKSPVATTKAPALATNERWRWPVNGPVVRPFVATGQAHKGVDIKGKMGEPVYASRSGVVVYAGSGLVGYGNLLILKHSDRYLSAYGHNRRLTVKEGDNVKVGQVIAELGDSGTDSVKLHFEVRVDGKPVDPLRLLPRR